MGQQLITDVGCFTTSTKDKINANFTELYNSGGGAPGGADTQVQFNDAGSFGGDERFTYGVQPNQLRLSLSTGQNYPTLGVLAFGRGPMDGDAGDLITVQNYANDFSIELLGVRKGSGDNMIQVADGWLEVNWDTGATNLSGTLEDLKLANGKALQTDTTTGHTALLQAYDVDGAAYKTFATLTNGNTPSLNISQPGGGVLAFIPPTADPHVVGALWNNAGTLTISAG